jgi:hypothetical protein
MAREYREPPRRTIDPLMEICIEGVAAGYRGVEYVREGLSESLRRRPGSGYAGRARHGRGRTGRGRAGTTVVGDIADLTAELLDRLGETAQGVAGHIGEQFEGGPHCPTLELCGFPGDTDRVKFRLTNTSASALTDVSFQATDLLGACRPIDASAVRFGYPDDDGIARIRSGGSTIVIVEVAIPEDAEPGTYRGVIATCSTRPAGRGQLDGETRAAWALIEVDVAAPDPRRAVARADRPQAE